MIPSPASQEPHSRTGGKLDNHLQRGKKEARERRDERAIPGILMATGARGDLKREI